MDPQQFDGMAGLALGVLLPLSVLFVASAIRVSRAPWWTWLVFLAVAGGLLLGSGDLDWTRYSKPLVDDDYGWYDGGQFLGFLLGWAGVAVNAVLSAVHGLVTDRRRRSTRRFTSLEARLLTASSLALAAACATPAAWWAAGAGLPPWSVPVLPAATGLALAVVVSVRGHRRGLGLDTPVYRVASAIVGSMLAVAVVSSGSGGPDVSLVPDAAPEPTPASTPDPWADWPVAHSPHPSDTTTLDAAAVQAGTRAMLEDTVRWAGPLDDLTSPTPVPAPAPPVSLTQESCASGGSRWTGTLTLPTVRPQDLADRVLDGWADAGYTARDRAMGTDTRWPTGTDAAVQRMQLGGDRTGVHVTAESFCVR